MIGLVCIIALALGFDFLNGFHDAANSIATVVSTRVLTPGQAVVWAAFFNFIAFLVFSTHIAGNIARGVDASIVTIGLVGAGLVGAVVWGLLTWWWGLPTSSSHALLGGLAGAAIVKGGFRALDYAFFGKTLVFIVVAPLLGMTLGYGIFTLVRLVFGHVAGQGRPPLSARAARQRRPLLARPRRQRRAEDDGHHRRGADRGASGST